MHKSNITHHAFHERFSSRGILPHRDACVYVNADFSKNGDNDNKDNHIIKLKARCGLMSPFSGRMRCRREAKCM